MNIEELNKRAQKAVELLNLFNKTFPNSIEQNTLVVFMAAIKDGYNNGVETTKSKYNLKDVLDNLEI